MRELIWVEERGIKLLSCSECYWRFIQREELQRGLSLEDSKEQYKQMIQKAFAEHTCGGLWRKKNEQEKK
jgi:hypothetical protein